MASTVGARAPVRHSVGGTHLVGVQWAVPMDLPPHQGVGGRRHAKGGGSRQFRLCVQGRGGERAHGRGEGWGHAAEGLRAVRLVHVEHPQRVPELGHSQQRGRACACRLTQSLHAQAFGEMSLQHVPCFDSETHPTFHAMLMSVLAILVQQHRQPCSCHVDGWCRWWRWIPHRTRGLGGDVSHGDMGAGVDAPCRR